ncbi:MAG: twitching motility protein PilT [Deltaproteobacteria bacterium RIFOXYD12_FULL_50_9]|nr:MAG: twitching motility protein PilT [Deltaproteobacteria bacterium RIFOXYD12_FULL_50_9]
MTAVDTNIIVRLLTRDDQEQFRKSKELFAKATIFISDTVLLETEWVLRYAYQFKTPEICTALEKLLGLPNVKVAQPGSIAHALEWTRKGLDFADSVHLATSHHLQHEQFATFDQQFISRANGLTKCRVQAP